MKPLYFHATSMKISSSNSESSLDKIDSTTSTESGNTKYISNFRKQEGGGRCRLF